MPVHGASSVLIGYDNANRRTSLTLPNGVAVTYAYNNANELTGLTYKKGAVTLGTLTYSYDLAGRRITQDGTYARTGLPAAMSGTVFDANNRLTSQGATNFTYDLNGNLTGDGANTYTWNARDQLTAISGAVAASFQYDAAGRRLAKTIAGATTKFFYDGINIIQELNVSNVATANLLTGLGIDEVYSRTDIGGTQSFLSDALGSTIAMADSAGAIAASYTYEPYGKASKTGTTSNTQTYTGREDDGTGLYYYRARYYHPTLSRFISEDPIGYAAGPNVYAYVGGNPVIFKDSRGLNPGTAIGAGIGSFVLPGPGTIAGAVIGTTIGVGVGYLIYNNRGNPLEGPSGEWVTSPNGKQDRQYGSDGYPSVDIDRGHDHGAGDPHAHNWDRPSDGSRPDRSNRGPGVPISPVPNTGPNSNFCNP